MEQMQAQIENLVKLQAIEVERKRLTKAANELPLQIAETKAALTAAEKEVARLQKSLDSEEKRRAKLEQEAEGHRQKATRFRAQLDVVKTPAQADAMEHEIQFAEAEIARLEDEELASLEISESQEAALVAAHKTAETATLAVQKTRDRVALRQTEYSRAQEDLVAQREAVRKLIDEELLRSFDRLAASRGTGLAQAEKQRCNGCLMTIRPQLWNQLREGELLTCDNCGRLLYWDPSLAPAVNS
jgi:hypothetical protein